MSKKKKTERNSDNLPDRAVDNQELLEELSKIDLQDSDPAQVMAVIMKASRKYRGPLPTAEQFQIYEQTCEGAGERILSCMEKEQKHRHKMDARAIDATIAETTLGQWLGFWVIVAFLITASLAILMGNPWVAAILGGVGGIGAIGGVAKKFIDGREPRNNKQ